jgi:hypothetical protein
VSSAPSTAGVNARTMILPLGLVIAYVIPRQPHGAGEPAP